MTCHQPVGQAVVLSDVPPWPLNAPMERHLVAKSHTNLGLVDLSSDYLEFSRVLCNRLSSFFICSPQMPPTHPAGPLMPLHPLSAPNSLHTHSQYMHLVVKSGTTAGQHDMSSACGSGCCFVRCTCQYRHLVIRSGVTSGHVVILLVRLD